MPDLYGRLKRNLTDELIEGASDGAIKKAAPNWSQRIHDVTDSARRSLSHVEGGYDWDDTDGPTRSYVRGYVKGA